MRAASVVLFAALLALPARLPAQLNWVTIDKLGTAADTGRVTRLAALGDPKPVLRTMVAAARIDCRAMRFRVFGTTYYDRRGNTLFQDYQLTDDEWHDFTPEGRATMARHVCPRLGGGP